MYFAFDKFNVENQYKEMLKQKSDLMKQFPSIRVRIEGNCDDRGTQEYNLALGERRARAAYEYLVMLGVNPNQLRNDQLRQGKPRRAGQQRSRLGQEPPRRLPRDRPLDLRSV